MRQHLPFIALALALVTASARYSPAQLPTSGAARVAVNDNRAAAGVLHDGVLTVRLQAAHGEWHPDRDTDPGVVVRAFGEEGKPLQIPGPLIRVPAGTEIRVSVRNTFSDSTLIVHGLAAPNATAGTDTIHVKPGELRDVRFVANVPGTYYYRARTSTGFAASQLNGAIIVDGKSSSSAAQRDRVFVLGVWAPALQPGAVLNRNTVLRFVINGKAWPNTERLDYTVGDTVRMRIVNTSTAAHPMHLHGFYFNVDSRGDGRSDTTHEAGSRHLAVTERAGAGRTFSLTWVPERAGNWMFHCHDNFHVLRNRPLDGTPLPPEEEHLAHVKNHAMEMMGGLVMGIEVRPKGPSAAARETGPRRALRLVARVDSGGGGTVSEPAYGYVLQDGKKVTPNAGLLLPGPTIVLKKGEPVSITVVNNLAEGTSVHWHGIELDSYFDGVAGFSGFPGRISPAIAPRDSFVARFTPPRAGTFIYHPHADEVRQQQAGLSGAIVVVDDPRTFDPEKDVVLLLSIPRRNADAGVILLNGTNTPALREWRVGERYRLRFINIHTARPSMIGRLMQDSTVLTWRAVAKDGADLPPERATIRPAVQQIGNGEAYDFEFIPSAPGDLHFTVTASNGTPLVTMPIRVR
jgi:manganese oxidase